MGKTVLFRQIIEGLLSEGIAATRVLYIPFDELPTLRGFLEPVLAIARWFENRVLCRSYNQAAQEGQPAYLFVDEAQNSTKPRTSIPGPRWSSTW